jgi:hypothetical protein
MKEVIDIPGGFVSNPDCNESIPTRNADEGDLEAKRKACWKYRLENTGNISKMN